MCSKNRSFLSYNSLNTPLVDTRDLDAVAWVRQVRDNHYRLLQGQTAAERIAFYQAHAQQMQARVAELLAAQAEEAETDEN